MIKEAIYSVGNWCNLRCPHCFKDAGTANPNDIPIEEIMNFLDKFPELKSLKLTGGEPLGGSNYEKIYKISNYCIDREIEVTINTNGTFDIPNFDLDSKMVTFQLSLDGKKEIHDSIRGHGVFDKAINFMKKQKDKGYGLYVMHVIMGQESLKELEDFIDFITITNLTPMEVQFMTPNGRGENKDIEKTLKEEDVEKLVRLRGCNVNMERCGFRPIIRHCETCLGNRLSIDEEGYITPCPMLGRYRFGTIYDYDEEKVKKEMHEKIGTCTCSFPEGYTGKF